MTVTTVDIQNHIEALEQAIDWITQIHQSYDSLSRDLPLTETQVAAINLLVGIIMQQQARLESAKRLQQRMAREETIAQERDE